MRVNKLIEDGITGAWVGEILDDDGQKIGEFDVMVTPTIRMADGSQRPSRHIWTIRDAAGDEIATGEFLRP
jgi:hypothetical protein